MESIDQGHVPFIEYRKDTNVDKLIAIMKILYYNALNFLEYETADYVFQSSGGREVISSSAKTIKKVLDEILFTEHDQESLTINNEKLIVPSYIKRIIIKMRNNGGSIYDLLFSEKLKDTIGVSGQIEILINTVFDATISQLNKLLGTSSSKQLLLEAGRRVIEIDKIAEILDKIFLQGELPINKDLLMKRIEAYKNNFYTSIESPTYGLYEGGQDVYDEESNYSMESLAKTDDDHKTGHKGIDIEEELSLYDEDSIETNQIYQYSIISSTGNTTINKMFSWASSSIKNVGIDEYIEQLNNSIFKKSKNGPSALVKYIKQEYNVTDNKGQDIKELFNIEADKVINQLSKSGDIWEQHIKEIGKYVKQKIDIIEELHNQIISSATEVIRIMNDLEKSIKSYQSIKFNYNAEHNHLEAVNYAALNTLFGDKYDKIEGIKNYHEANYFKIFSAFYFESALFLTKWVLLYYYKKHTKQFAKHKYAVNPVNISRVGWDLPMAFVSFDDKGKPIARKIDEIEAFVLVLLGSYLTTIIKKYDLLKDTGDTRYGITEYIQRTKSDLSIYLENYMKAYTSLIINLFVQVKNMNKNIEEYKNKAENIAKEYKIEYVNEKIQEINQFAREFANMNGLKDVNGILDDNQFDKFYSFLSSKDVDIIDILVRLSEISENVPFYYPVLVKEKDVLIPYRLEIYPFTAIHFKEIQRIINFLYVVRVLTQLYPIYGVAISRSRLIPEYDYYIYERMCYASEREQFFGVDPVDLVKIKNQQIQPQKAVRILLEGVHQIAAIRKDLNMSLIYKSSLMDKEKTKVYNQLKEAGFVGAKFNVMFHSMMTRYAFQVNVYKVMANYSEIFSKDNKQLDIMELFRSIINLLKKELNVKTKKTENGEVDIIEDDRLNSILSRMANGEAIDMQDYDNFSLLEGLFNKVAFMLSTGNGVDKATVERFKFFISYIKSIGDRIGFHMNFPMKSKSLNVLTATNLYPDINVLHYESQTVRNFMAHMRGRIFDNNRKVMDAIRNIIGQGTIRYEQTEGQSNMWAKWIQKRMNDDPYV